MGHPQHQHEYKKKGWEDDKKELLQIKDAKGNKPIQMMERATYNRVHLIYEKHNRERVAQIGTGLGKFLQSIFPLESILVLRKLESTGYFGELGHTRNSSQNLRRNLAIS